MITKTSRHNQYATEVLIGMIVNDRVMAEISIHWKHDLFTGKDENLISKWCYRHYQKYNCAPSSDIKGYFTDYELKNPKQAPIRLMEMLLQQINDEYEASSKDINSKVLIDRANILFQLIDAA